MTAIQPATDTITSDDALEQWEALLDRVSRREARFVVERDGKPVAALISPRELEMLDRHLRKRAELAKAIDEIREAFKDVPDEEIEREIARAIAEVRAENRQREQAQDLAATS